MIDWDPLLPAKDAAKFLGVHRNLFSHLNRGLFAIEYPNRRKRFPLSYLELLNLNLPLTEVWSERSRQVINETAMSKAGLATMIAHEVTFHTVLDILSDDVVLNDGQQTRALRKYNFMNLFELTHPAVSEWESRAEIEFVRQDGKSYITIDEIYDAFPWWQPHYLPENALKPPS